MVVLNHQAQVIVTEQEVTRAPGRALDGESATWSSSRTCAPAASSSQTPRDGGSTWGALWGAFSGTMCPLIGRREAALGHSLHRGRWSLATALPQDPQSSPQEHPTFVPKGPGWATAKLPREPGAGAHSSRYPSLGGRSRGTGLPTELSWAPALPVLPVISPHPQSLAHICQSARTRQFCCPHRCPAPTPQALSPRGSCPRRPCGGVTQPSLLGPASPVHGVSPWSGLRASCPPCSPRGRSGL